MLSGIKEEEGKLKNTKLIWLVTNLRPSTQKASTLKE
jgi:hypothetical protein